jgi:hypothetical protein
VPTLFAGKDSHHKPSAVVILLFGIAAVTLPISSIRTGFTTIKH